MRRTSRGLLLGLVLAASAAGQEADETVLEYGVPSPEEVHLDAYRDFTDFVAAEDWSRALRSIAEQLEHPPEGLLPSPGGVHLSYSERLWRDLARLPRDGRRAFRLFHDAKAARLLERVRAETDEHAGAALLAELYLRYFPTSSGDQAADALARRALEAERPAEAAHYWGSLLEHHRDTDLDRRLIGLELCAALSASGRVQGLAVQSERLSLRYGTDEVEWRGQRVTVDEALAELDQVAGREGGPEFGPRLDLPTRPMSAWRLGMARWEASQNRGGFWVANEGGQEAPVPVGVVVDGDVVLDHGGKVLRLSAAEGEQRWSAGAHPSSVQPFQLQGRLFAQRAGDLVLVAGDARSADGAPEVHLVCLEVHSGLELWSTGKDKAYQELGVVGRPTIDGETVYAVVQRRGTYNLELCAIALEDGELRWRAQLGTPVSAAASNPWMWMGSGAVLPISPQVIVADGEVLVVTDSCAVLAVDPKDGRISWAYTRPVERRFEDGPSPGSSFYLEGVLYLRSQGNRSCFALDIRARRELWSARVDPSERLVAWDADHVYLLGDNLRALDRQTGQRIWSRPIQVPRDARRVVQTEEHLYVLTRRGLFEVEKASGDNGRTPVRGVLSKMGGGDLYLVGDQLVCVGREEILAVTLGS